MQKIYLDSLTQLEEMRQRVYRRRDAHLLDPADFTPPQRISVCEGGCLFPAHPSLALAANKVLLHPTKYPTHIYPQQSILPAFVERLKSFFANECGIEEKYSDNVIFASGISQLFDAFIPAVCESGDIILAPESYYHGFVAWPHKWGVSHLGVPTRLENGFKLTAADLDVWFKDNAAISHKAKAILLTSPTTAGAVYSRDELVALAGVIADRRLMVFVDEVFRDTVFADSEMVSLAAIPAAAPFCVTAHSGAKGRSAANFRIGWACGPAPVITRMQKICDQSVTEYPFILQAVAEAALNLPESLLQAARAEWALRSRRVQQQLALANARLRRRFGVARDLLELPLQPGAAHSVMLRFENLRGARTPQGRVIDTSIDLAEYLLDPQGDGSGEGVCLSVGATKGHRDLICYFAFSQTGHEYMAAASEPALKAYMASHLFGDGQASFAPDYTQALEYGRRLNDIAVERIEQALARVALPANRLPVLAELPMAAE